MNDETPTDQPNSAPDACVPVSGDSAHQPVAENVSGVKTPPPQPVLPVPAILPLVMPALPFFLSYLLAHLISTNWSQLDNTLIIERSILGISISSLHISFNAVRRFGGDDFTLAAWRMLTAHGLLLGLFLNLPALPLYSVLKHRYRWKPNYKNVSHDSPLRTALRTWFLISTSMIAMSLAFRFITGHDIDLGWVNYVPSLVLFSWKPTILFAVMVCVIAPLFEEVIFRGCLQRLLERWFSANASTVTQAVLFGLIHYTQNLPGVLFTGTIGFIFGRIYRKTGMLWVPMLVHALMNLSTLAWMLLWSNVAG
jgi:membrane protease YdiL (CAAX protease family)